MYERAFSEHRPLRLVLVGAGLIAANIVRCALAQGHELVGAVDIDPEKLGRDCGDVLGLAPVGAEIVDDVASVAVAADVALVATGSTLRSVSAQLISCIERGLDVVSTCEELAYPWRTQPDLAANIDERATRADVTVVGAGINPGFVMDVLAVTLSAPCSVVRSVKIHRTLDAGTRRASFRKKVGVGLTDAEFAASVASGALGHVGLAESAWMISDRLGLGGVRVVEQIDPVKAADDTIAGMHQTAVLQADGPVVELEMTMAVGVSDPLDAIELLADPPIKATIAGGVPGDAGTAGVVVNAAVAAFAAPAGLVTLDQLPLVHSRMRVPTPYDHRGRASRVEA